MARGEANPDFEQRPFKIPLSRLIQLQRLDTTENAHTRQPKPADGMPIGRRSGAMRIQSIFQIRRDNAKSRSIWTFFALFLTF